MIENLYWYATASEGVVFFQATYAVAALIALAVSEGMVGAYLLGRHYS